MPEVPSRAIFLRSLPPQTAGLFGALAVGAVVIGLLARSSRMSSEVSSRSRPPRAALLLALGLGAASLGALAIGALAVGAVAIGRLAVGKARFRELEVDELTVRKLHVLERDGPAE